MAYWATAKVLNTGLWVSAGLYQWGYWLVRGTPDSNELKVAKTNQIQLNKIEQQLDQMWVLQNNMLTIPTTLTDSIVLVEKDGSEQKIHKDK